MTAPERNDCSGVAQGDAAEEPNFRRAVREALN
jgi:hypothetical protein